MNIRIWFQRKRLSIVNAVDYEKEFPASPSYLISPVANSTSVNSYDLSGSITNMSISGNGLANSTEIHCSTKSASPTGSVTSISTLSGKVDLTSSGISAEELEECNEFGGETAKVSVIDYHLSITFALKSYNNVTS